MEFDEGDIEDVSRLIFLRVVSHVEEANSKKCLPSISANSCPQRAETSRRPEERE